MTRSPRTTPKASSKRGAKPPRRTRARASIGAARSPETHQAILEAAAAILEQSGYAGFSMDALAQRARSSKPTLYRWWPNKALLIMEVYESANEAALGETDTGSLRGDLILRLTRLWTWWEKTWAGEALRSIIAEAQIDPITLNELNTEFLANREAFLLPVFERAVARRELRDHSGTSIAIAHLVGVSWLYLLTRRLGQLDAIEPHVDAIIRALPLAKRAPKA